MNKRMPFLICLLITVLLVAAVGQALAQTNAPQTSIGPAFTYQGQLTCGGSPNNDSCDFTFSLYDAQATGTQIGAVQPLTLAVSGGLFTALLNTAGEFGPSVFDGGSRWLDISIKCAGETAPVEMGRQEITAVPYASYAITDGSVTNGVVTSGSYADPAWLTLLSARKLTGVLPVANGGTGSTTQNFVDLSSSQTITSGKIFSHEPAFNTGTILGHAVPPFTVGQFNSAGVDNLNADLLDGQHAAPFQARVNGACTLGGTIEALNPDSAVVCPADYSLNRTTPSQANSITPLDSADVGRYSSITLRDGWTAGDQLLRHHKWRIEDGTLFPAPVSLWGSI